VQTNKGLVFSKHFREFTKVCAPNCTTTWSVKTAIFVVFAKENAATSWSIRNLIKAIKKLIRNSMKTIRNFIGNSIKTIRNSENQTRLTSKPLVGTIHQSVQANSARGTWGAVR